MIFLLRFLISALLIVSGVFPQRCALIVPSLNGRLVHCCRLRLGCLIQRRPSGLLVGDRW